MIAYFFLDDASLDDSKRYGSDGHCREKGNNKVEDRCASDEDRMRISIVRQIEEEDAQCN